MAAVGIDVQPEVTFHAAHEIFTPHAGVVAATDTPNSAMASNVDLVRGGYAAFAAGDIPAVLALFADDLVWTTLESVRFGGAYRGPQGAAEFFTKLPQNYAELHVEPERFIEAGDSVLVQGRHRGRTVSGNAFDVPWMHLWTFRDGKATSFTEVFDSAPVAQALGGTGRSGDEEAILRRMFDEIINQGRLERRRRTLRRGLRRPRTDGRHRRAGGASSSWSPQWRDAVPDVHCEVDTVIVRGRPVRLAGADDGHAHRRRARVPGDRPAIRDGERQHRPASATVGPSSTGRSRACSRCWRRSAMLPVADAHGSESAHLAPRRTLPRRIPSGAESSGPARAGAVASGVRRRRLGQGEGVPHRAARRRYPA